MLKKIQRWNKRAFAVKGKGVRVLYLPSPTCKRRRFVQPLARPSEYISMTMSKSTSSSCFGIYGVQAESEAVAFSTIELLRTVQYVLLCGMPLHFMTDGTHKLSFDRWVMQTVETTTIRPRPRAMTTLSTPSYPSRFNLRERRAKALYAKRPKPRAQMYCTAREQFFAPDYRAKSQCPIKVHSDV